MIVKGEGGYHVKSDSGKSLGGPYKSRKAARKRLRQVEYFKHRDSKPMSLWMDEFGVSLAVETQPLPFNPDNVLRTCLEVAGDAEIALAATEYILSTKPLPDKPQATPSINAYFAHDIHDKAAQGVLNRALKAVRGLNAQARKDLATALRTDRSGGTGEAVLAFVDRYRLQLARLLTTTQLAAVLEGARGVAAKVPTLAEFPGAIPPPPTLEPREALEIVDRLAGLMPDEQAKAIYDLPPDHQVYVQQALAASAAPPPVVPSIVPTPTGGGAPEDVHFPTIDEAVRNLQERNVMDRQRYDALDAAARAKAFTVANVEAQETLEKIRDSLAENVRQGADYETWTDRVLEDVGTGTFLSDAHQENVFRTNVQTAYSDGQEKVLSHPLIRSGFPYRERNAIHDDRVEETHLALEHLGIQGTNVYRADDPVWQMFRAPWRWMCRCNDNPLTVRQAAERGIEEAVEWLRTGVEPATKAHVEMPDFRPLPGFQRAVASAPLSIQLSMQPLAYFSAHDVGGEKRANDGKWTKGSNGTSAADTNDSDTLPDDLDLPEGFAQKPGMLARIAHMVRIAKTKLTAAVLAIDEPLATAVIPNAYDHARNALLNTALPGVPVNDLAVGLSKVLAWAWTKITSKRSDGAAMAIPLDGPDAITAVLKLTKVMYEMCGLPADTPLPSRKKVMRQLRKQPSNRGKALALSIEHDDRLQLMAEIIVLMFGEDAEEQAEELFGDTGEDSDFSLAFAIPKVTRRYGKKPGPAWVQGGTSSNGQQIWLWSPSSASGTAGTMHTPAAPPPTAPTPPHTPAPPPVTAPTTTSTFTPVPVPPVPPGVAGGVKARAQSIAAYNSAMAKLTAGQQLTTAEKTALATKLTNMPTTLLRNLHSALGGTGALGSAKQVVANVRNLLASTTAATPPAPPPPTAATPPAPAPVAPPPTPAPAPTSVPTGLASINTLISTLQTAPPSPLQVRALTTALTKLTGSEVDQLFTHHNLPASLHPIIGWPNNPAAATPSLLPSEATAIANHLLPLSTPSPAPASTPTPAPTPAPTPLKFARPPLGSMPPGPPPWAGLVWDATKHRWVLPAGVAGVKTGDAQFDGAVNGALRGYTLTAQRISDARNAALFTVQNKDIVDTINALGGTVTNPTSSAMLANDLFSILHTVNSSNAAALVAPAAPPPVAVPTPAPAIPAGTTTPKGALARPTAPTTQQHVDLATATPVDYSGKNGAMVDSTWSGLDYPGVQPKYGAIVSRVDPATGKVQVLLAKPTNYFGNTSWTWAKGTQDPGNDAVTTATEEAMQEVGAKGDIVGHLTGTYAEGSKSGLNAYFIMRQTGAINVKAWQANGETADIQWVDIDQAHTLIGDTAKHVTDANGTKQPSFVNWQRDADVLEQAKAALIPGYVPKVNRRVDMLGKMDQDDAAKIRAVALAAHDGLITSAQAQTAIASILPMNYKDIAGAMRAGTGTPQDFLNAVAKADPGQPVLAVSPPGPPPRPGLVWNPTTHRWVLPPTVAAPPPVTAHSAASNNPIVAPLPATPTMFVPKTHGVGANDREDLDYHVGKELANLGLTAEQALAQHSARGIYHALSGTINHSVDQYTITRTLKNLYAQQTTVPIPAQFIGGAGGHGPKIKRHKNAKLPDEARPRLTADERVAAQKWTSSAFIPWARALRETDAPPPQFAKADADLQSAFAKAKVFAAPVAVERHLTLDAALLQQLVTDAQTSLSSGRPVQYRGYQATSTDPVPSNFHGNVEMRINAVHGLDMGLHHHHPHVKELLLNHNAQLKVTNVQQVGGKWIISYDQLPPVGAKPAKGATAPAPVAAPAKDFDPHDVWTSSSAVADYLAGKIPVTTGHGTGKDYTLLNAILKEAGRSGKPQVLPQSGIDNLKQQGWKIGHRGNKHVKFASQFRNQDFYTEGGPGLRAYGSGTYFAHGSSESSSLSTAKGYGRHVLRLALDPTMRVYDYGKLKKDQQKVLNALDADKNAGAITHSEYRARYKVMEDEGLFAALHNYDAIDTGSVTGDYWILLNRSKVAVQDKNL